MSGVEPEREPSPARPTVLFVCVHNAGRSQMAAALLREVAGDRIEVLSAGSEPADQVNPVAVAALAEIGIDLGETTPRILAVDDVRASDVVITMGCGDACPVFPGKRYEDWALDDPAGQPLERVRPIFNEIYRRVTVLAAELLGTTVEALVFDELSPGWFTIARARAWNAGQLALWHRLRGARIIEWLGTEEAILVGDDYDWAPVVDTGARQHLRLGVRLGDGGWLRIQAGDEGPLVLEEADYPVIHQSLPPEPGSIHRPADLSGFPVGDVEGVELALRRYEDPANQIGRPDRRGGDHPVELLLTVSGRRMLLMAAEYPEVPAPPADGVSFRWPDESLVVFLEPERADAHRWPAERDELDRITIPPSGSSTPGV
ncbi:hypothetical protein GCM10027515_31230 [Schumannella luteola]|uniref:Protein-tyrosine-phosphatase n=1 Tax=Schumannella luteola TaxID=472059 RepID=A0A852Y7Z7_9MICO|nr:protein-tyrosine-phosphatase [Schumannella luteola]